MSYVLGLDIGSNSIGWAILDAKDNSVIDTNTRVFPEEGKGGSVKKGGKTVRVSQRAKRGVDRRSRRCRDRRCGRNDELMNLLTKASLLPSDAKSRDDLLNDKDVKDKKEISLRPYKLRSKGLNERLTLFEFGRVIIHLSKRRGYQTNRKSGDPTEDKSIGKEAEKLLKEMGDSKSRTLGEYLYKVSQGQVQDISGFIRGRIRNRHTFRAMYKDEFDKLWESQKQFHKELFKKDELKKEISDKIFYQRPVRYLEPGNCDIDGKPKCLKACWQNRQFVLWQKVNNFRIETAFKEPQLLSEPQRQKVFELLSTNKTVTFQKIREELKDSLPERAIFNFEENGKKEKIGGDGFLSEIRKIWGDKSWDSLNSKRQEIVDYLAEEDNESLIRTTFRNKYKLDDEKIGAVLKIHIPEGRANFSKEALDKLLEYVAAGKRTDEAILLAYPQDKIKPARIYDKLPPVDPIENHIVMKAMCELRNLVNCIIDTYGKPSCIKIEMARDLNKSRQEKDKISRQIKENTERNESKRQELKKLEMEYNVQIPQTPKNVVKYRLWEETNKMCVYCGVTIHPTKLFGEYQDCEVEHILPQKRSLQTSDYNNLTLSHIRCNRLKDNLMPFEAYKNSPDEYHQLLKRVFASDMPIAKKMRFLKEKLDLEEAISRNLNDTRYVNRQAIAYLKKLGVDVFGTKGRATDLLRKESGFDTLLEAMAVGKKHDDNRNHAVDAVIVGLTTPKLLRNLARKYEAGNGYDLAKKWAHIREQLQEKLKKIYVSYRPRYRISDGLHEETAFGLSAEVKKVFQSGTLEKISEHAWICHDKLPYIVSKDISDVVKTVGDIETELPLEAINIKNAILDKLKSNGVDINDKKAEVPWEKMVSDDDKKKAGLIEDKTVRIFINSKNGKKIPVRKIRTKKVHSNMLIITDEKDQPYKAYLLKKNHHIEVYESSEGKIGLVITQIEAARRRANNKPIVQKNAKNGKFLYSLARNEMFMAELDDGTKLLHRVEKISEDLIILRPHTYGGVCKDTDPNTMVLRRSPNSLRGYKVRVDRLGRIYPAND